MKNSNSQNGYLLQRIFNYDKLRVDYEVLEGSNWLSFIFVSFNTKHLGGTQ